MGSSIVISLDTFVGPHIITEATVLLGEIDEMVPAVQLEVGLVAKEDVWLCQI